jgi:hypothetical protein
VVGFFLAISGCAGRAPTAPDGGADAAVSRWTFDCVDRHHWEDPRCRPPSEIAPGSIGIGPAFVGPKGAFVDGDTLVLLASPDVVMTVDLRTGDRALRSGTLEGSVTRGEGPSIADAHDLRRGPSGQWYVATGDGIYEVDPATGDRRFDRSFDRCEADPIGLTHLGWGFAIDGDGIVYIAGGVPDAGAGVLAVDAASNCRVVSWAARHDLPSVGGGTSYSAEIYLTPTLHEGDLYVTGDDTLYRIELATGDRERLSSGFYEIGSGPSFPMSSTRIGLRSRDRLCVVGSAGPDAVIEVDLTTGDRAAWGIDDGPFRELLAPDRSAKLAVAHPHLSGAMIIATETALLVVEPETGNSVTLSH